jgi:chorismate synthase
VSRLRLRTAGESHGPAVLALLEGIPHGLPLETAHVDRLLRRRQLGYGRGARQRIEKDQVEFLAGVRHGRTLGSPLALLVRNLDWENWKEEMAAEPPPPGWESKRRIRAPRPGHADLAGALKLLTLDPRDVLERASARETAARVAGGAVCVRLLEELGIGVRSHIRAVGEVELAGGRAVLWEEIEHLPEEPDGLPPGLGSCAQWDRRLDGRLLQAVGSIQGVKAAEIGDGVRLAGLSGSLAHDEIHWDGAWFHRSSNRAGGIEGGMTNGEEVRVRGYMKPHATLRVPLASVDLETKEEVRAAVERSDVCSVAAAGVVGEAVVAYVLADALLEKFGGDSLDELRASIASGRRLLEERFRGAGRGGDKEDSDDR